MNTKDDVAKELARRHYQIEAGISTIIRITGSGDVEINPTEPIKLLEVNENTIVGGVMPLQFGPVPDAGIDYPSMIVEVTPDEFQRIQSKELVLPAGWTLGEAFPRPDESVATVRQYSN